MNVYIVIRSGVYRNVIVGARTSLIAAQLVAERAIQKERDDWHRFEVVEIPLDAYLDEKVVAVLRREMSLAGEIKRLWWDDK